MSCKQNALRVIGVIDMCRTRILGIGCSFDIGRKMRSGMLCRKMRLQALWFRAAVLVTALGMFTFGSITPEVLTEAVMCTTMLYPIIHRRMAFTRFTLNPTYIPVSMIPLGYTAGKTWAWFGHVLLIGIESLSELFRQAQKFQWQAIHGGIM